ncbi:ester cyclase [Deinococcus misasensis]|uniref:nuclear transport factor 2 family protein n=1 Tax=Deinococcus misasensis TaxID=392413 RepID=UPI00068F6138|nr:ester cyclase [Deinococcus misasensis]
MTAETGSTLNASSLAYRLVQWLNGERHLRDVPFSEQATLSFPVHARHPLSVAGFEQHLQSWQAALPDHHIEITGAVCHPERVLLHIQRSGRHLGEDLHTVAGTFPPSGQKCSVTGMLWVEAQHGKIQQVIVREDVGGLLRQLGHTQNPADSEPHLHTARRYFTELMNEGRLETIEEILTEDFQFIIPTQPVPLQGHEAMRRFVTRLRTVFPDVHFKVEQDFAQGHQVAALWSLTGTHSDTFLGIEASGRKVHDSGIDIFVFEGERIKTLYVNQNDLELLEQLRGK